MARDMRIGKEPDDKRKKYLRLGYVQREPPARGKTKEKKDIKHECAGGSQNYGLCRTSPSATSPASKLKRRKRKRN